MGDINVGNLIVGIQTKLNEFKAEMQGAAKEVSELAGIVDKHKESIADVGAGFAVAGGAIVGALGLSVVSSMAFNKEMANVSTMLGGSKEKTNELKDAIQDMSVKVGKSTSDLAIGAYQVISAFGDTADAVSQLEISSIAATAGVATTSDAINLLSSVSKGYGDTSTKMLTQISDLAFTTVNLGQTTFPELAQSIGSVVPLANELGVSQKELFAVMATGTGVTGNAGAVSTQFRGILQSLMAPTENMTKLVEANGFSSGKAMLSQKGLSETLALITNEAKKTGEPLQSFIGSIEGQTLALALSGSQVNSYKDKLESMNKSAGAAKLAFIAQTEGVNSAGFSWEQLKQSIVGITQELGDALQPAIKTVTTLIKNVTETIRNFLQDHPNMATGLTLTAAAVGLIATAIGGLLLLSIPVATFVLSMEAIGPAVTAAKLAFSSLTPIFSVGAPFLIGLAAVAAAVYLIITNWDHVCAVFKALWETVLSPVIIDIANAFDTVTDGIKIVWQSAWNKIDWVFKQIWTFFAPLIDGILTGWGTVQTIAQTVWGAIWDTIKGVLEKIWNTFQWVMKQLGVNLPEAKDVFTQLGDAGKGAASKVETGWNKFKASYDKNMDAQKKKSVETNDEIEKKSIAAEQVLQKGNTETKDTVIANDKKKSEAVKQTITTIKEEDVKANQERQDSWATANENMTSGFITFKNELVSKYGDMLTEEEYDEAASLQSRGEDWEKYVAKIETIHKNSWSSIYENIKNGFNESLGFMTSDLLDSINNGDMKGGLDGLKQSFGDAFTDIAFQFESKLLSGMKSKLTDVFSGMGSSIAGIAGSIGTLGVAAIGGALVNKVVGAFTPDYEKNRKDREIEKALTNEYYTMGGLETELKGSEWQYSEESVYQLKNKLNTIKADIEAGEYMKYGGRSQATALLNAVQGDWSNTESAIAAGYGYKKLSEMIQDNDALGKIIAEMEEKAWVRHEELTGKEYEDYLSAKANYKPDGIIKSLYGDTINFAELEALGRSYSEYQTFMPKFHAGGIIEGMVGQERTIRALAGEEVLTRSDPRHSENNYGGISVVITGNQINSEMDLIRLADMAGERILKKIKLQAALSY